MALQMEWMGAFPVLKSEGHFDHWALFLLPITDEASRLRRTVAQIMRDLARHGIGSALPDLIMQGENTIAPDRQQPPRGQADLAQLADEICPLAKRRIVCSFRSAASFDQLIPAVSYWRLAPVFQDFSIHYQYSMAASSVSELEQDITDPVRTVRLSSDPKAADMKILGAPLWRWAEPGEDEALTNGLAADIRQWVRQCAAS